MGHSQMKNEENVVLKAVQNTEYLAKIDRGFS